MPRLTAYIARRCLALVPQLLAISFVTFVLARQHFGHVRGELKPVRTFEHHRVERAVVDSYAGHKRHHPAIQAHVGNYRCQE